MQVEVRGMQVEVEMKVTEMKAKVEMKVTKIQLEMEMNVDGSEMQVIDVHIHGYNHGPSYGHGSYEHRKVVERGGSGGQGEGIGKWI